MFFHITPHFSGTVFFYSYFLRESPCVIAVIKTCLAAWFYSLALLLIGDFDLHPGPKRDSKNALSLESKQYIGLKFKGFSLRLLSQLVSLILFLNQKHTLNHLSSFRPPFKQQKRWCLYLLQKLFTFKNSQYPIFARKYLF